VAQCAAAVRLAASPEGGSHRRQRVQLLLPINQRKSEFTSVEADDYGMNDADVYKVAMETASAMIRLVDPNGGEMSAKRVDKDNDPVGVLQNAAGTVRALVIPNAQDLDALKTLASLGDANGTQVTLLVNPQWVESGQIISDFGIGPWKKRAMDFLDTFESTYALTESRVGAAATRDPARGWRLHGRRRRGAHSQDEDERVSDLRHGARRLFRVRVRRPERAFVRVPGEGGVHQGGVLASAPPERRGGGAQPGDAAGVVDFGRGGERGRRRGDGLEHRVHGGD
jgi:hypothetical protein